MVTILPELIVQVIAAVSGVIVSVGIPLVLTKLNKINKLYTTVFGLQEVSSIGGLVEDVEDNRTRLDELEDGQEVIKGKVEKIVDQVCDDN